jgi:CBS-domain-containing membrane protein
MPAVKIAEIMTPSVETCTTETTLPQVAKLMWSAGCGAIPVVDTHAKVVGIITDRDISNALFSTNRKPAHVPAREAMTPHVLACGPEDSIQTALDLMKRHGVRRLPVLSEAGQLRGIVSIDDVILRALAPGSPTPGEIVEALRDILERRNVKHEPELAS